MSKAEKENRIHSFALEFLEKQQIVPNLYADQIIRGYKEGYHQAEKDLALTWKDMKLIWSITDEMDDMPEEEFYQEVLNRFNKQKGR